MDQGGGEAFQKADRIQISIKTQIQVDSDWVIMHFDF